MKKIIIAIVVIAIAILGWMLVSNSASDVTEQTEGQLSGDDAVLEGVIVGVNTEQAPVDGPVLVTIETEGGDEVISIPTMGLPLCEARDNMADAFSLESGQLVSVRGERDGNGHIVPCESGEHYLRVE